MAIVANEWLDTKQRDDRIKKLNRSAKRLSKRMREGNYDDTDVATITSLDAEIKRLEAIQRAEKDVAFFAYQYFSDQFNRNNSAGNIIRDSEDGTPHESLDEIAPIHADFYDICDDVAWRKRTGNYVIASPRGHSKSSIISVILNLHQICFRKRHYLLILSETDSLSKKLVASIANQLKYNTRLREDFGELLYLKSLANTKDNEEAFITTTNILVEASSAGKSLRGKTFNNRRPDMITGDDLSSMNNEGTEQLRQKLIEWWNTVVMPLPAKDAAIIFVGTKVTGTGLLAHLLERRDFTSVFHQAILQHPTNQQLWSDYLHLYATEDEWTIVEEFYQNHREEMEADVILAWPARWSYRELMHTKHNLGSRSFASEFMNESFAADEQLFQLESYEYCRRIDSNGTPTIVYNDRYIPIHSLSITGAWDVALGQTKRSALNAFVTIGREDSTGLIFVLDVYASREYPSEFINRILEKMREYRHDKVVVEGIGAYWDFYRQLNERARVERIYNTRIEDVKSHGKKSKEQRIETLEPMFANKSLILNSQHHVLLEQLRNYMPGSHNLVDAIDALQIAIDNGGRRAIRVIQKPAWM